MKVEIDIPDGFELDEKHTMNGVTEVGGDSHYLITHLKPKKNELWKVVSETVSCVRFRDWNDWERTCREIENVTKKWFLNTFDKEFGYDGEVRKDITALDFYSIRSRMKRAIGYKE